VIAVNEPRTVRALVPASLAVGEKYSVEIVTQTPVYGHGKPLKALRRIASDFKVLARPALRESGGDRPPAEGEAPQL
jgi:hypothetical protein